MLIVLASLSYAQVCTIDYSQNSPGVYPAILPSGSINVPYSEELSILFPLSEMGVNYTSFKITSVELPMGLTWECSNEITDCIYYPMQDPFACMHIYGTPAEQGQFVINIEADAIKTDNSESVYMLQTSIEIVANSASNSMFSFSPALACETTQIDFSLINAISYTPIPGQTTGVLHEWEFGNGEVSSLENPATQTYSGPGEFVVSYTQIIDTVGFRLEGLIINSVGCTDIFGYGEPDVYVEIFDADGVKVYTNESSSNDADLPQTIGINLLLNNPPYTIRVMDDDSDNLTGTAPDNCIDNNGNSTVSTAIFLPPDNIFGLTTSVGNNGPLNFTYAIRKDSTHVVTTDTVTIFANPSLPSIAVDQNTPLTLSTTDLGHIYHWNKDNVRLHNFKGTEIQPQENGSYTVTAVDENGCYSTSNAELIDFTGLEAFNELIFNVFPNPASHVVNIAFAETLNSAEVLITDLAGRTLVKQSILGEHFIALDISTLANGVYTIAIANGNGQVSTKRLIVQ